tara:strand:+ start:45 stop:263 length:219 start_codon:yes stop_codon:yes gene_type:complete
MSERIKKFDSYGDGDMNETPRQAAMESMAKGGGLKGFMDGGSVLDPIMGKMKRGGTKKGMRRKTARRAYMKK